MQKRQFPELRHQKEGFISVPSIKKVKTSITDHGVRSHSLFPACGLFSAVNAEGVLQRDEHKGIVDNEITLEDLFD